MNTFRNLKRSRTNQLLNFEMNIYDLLNLNLENEVILSIRIDVFEKIFKMRKMRNTFLMETLLRMSHMDLLLMMLQILWI